MQAGDRIVSRSGNPIEIKEVSFQYNPKKVYNFEVSNWHTYFVGVLAWLVHNAKKCLRQLAREGIEYARRILRGIKFNKIMSKALGEAKYAHEVWLKGMKQRADTIMKNGKKLSVGKQQNCLKYLRRQQKNTLTRWPDIEGKEYKIRNVLIKE